MEQITKDYEKARSKSSDPFYLFNVTVQNHGGYVGNRGFVDTDIQVTNSMLSSDEVEQYVMSMDEWSFFENYTEEDQPMFHVYGDTNYRQMTIEIWDVDEESKTHTLTFYLYKIDKLWKIVLEE